MSANTYTIWWFVCSLEIQLLDIFIFVKVEFHSKSFRLSMAFLKISFIEISLWLIKCHLGIIEFYFQIRNFFVSSQCSEFNQKLILNDSSLNWNFVLKFPTKNTVVPRSYATPNYAIFAAMLFWIGSKKNLS